MTDAVCRKKDHAQLILSRVSDGSKPDTLCQYVYSLTIIFRIWQDLLFLILLPAFMTSSSFPFEHHHGWHMYWDFAFGPAQFKSS